MNSLDPSLIKSLATRLRARQSELLAQIAQSPTVEEAAAATTTGEVTDRKDQANESARLTLQDAELQLEQQELSRVEAALGRIAEGKYGLCTDCGETIDPDRLDVVPSAPRCRSCQSRFEARRLLNNP